MSVPWLYLAQLPSTAPSTCRVHADEARHATGSRRLRAGDAIWLFNGCGVIATAQISTTHHDGSLDASIESVCASPREFPDIEIASAIPKGDRLTTLLESIAPLAASRWTPLLCTHSVVTWSHANALRAGRVLIAACKQSQQPWLPVVSAEASPIQVARDAVARGRMVIIASPSGAPLATCIEGAQALTLLIGPEGGFTTTEVEAVESLGGRCASLGGAILRIELAVAYSLATARSVSQSRE